MNLVENYLEEIEKKHREASYVYVIKDGNLLLAEEAEDRYILPGGGTHDNETAEESAKREVLEEIAVDIKDLKQLGEHTFNFPKTSEWYTRWNYYNQTCTFYSAQFDGFNKELYGNGEEGPLKLKEMSVVEYEDYLLRRIEEEKNNPDGKILYYILAFKFLKMI